MKNEQGLNVILLGFIVISVGTVLVGSIADNVELLDDLNTINNDTFTGTNNTCVQVATGCLESIIYITNSTEGAAVNNNTLSSAYFSICESSTSSTNDDGIKVLLTADSVAKFSGKSLNATYEYSPDCTYMEGTTAKTLINLVVIFFAIAIVMIGVGMFMKMRDKL